MESAEGFRGPPGCRGAESDQHAHDARQPSSQRYKAYLERLRSGTELEEG